MLTTIVSAAMLEVYCAVAVRRRQLRQIVANCCARVYVCE